MNPLITVGNRQTGKTTQLLNAFLRDKNGIFVVANNMVRERILDKIHEIRLSLLKDTTALDKEVLTFDELKNNVLVHDELRRGQKLKGMKEKNIYIDDVDWLLQDMAGRHQIKGMVITLEQPQIRKNQTKIDATSGGASENLQAIFKYH